MKKLIITCIVCIFLITINFNNRTIKGQNSYYNSSLSITVEGNPTDWVNTDVELTVITNETVDILKWGSGIQDRIIIVKAGNIHTIALSEQGRVYTFGNNSSGQLGTGNNVDSSSPIDITDKFNLDENDKIVDIYEGEYHTAALSENGRVFTFGENGDGQLGTGNDIDYNTPQDITSNFYLEEGDKIVSASAGDHHTITITEMGRVFVFGDNYNGQLGFVDNSIDYYYPQEITSNFGLEPNDKLISVSAGNHHTIVISEMGRVYTFGDNYNGQLGLGNFTNASTPQDITSNFALQEGDKIVNINAGEHYTVAKSMTGKIFTFGYNRYGQLGIGDFINYNTPQDITSNFNLEEGDVIDTITVEGPFTIAKSKNGKVYTFGFNEYGQLGTNDYIDYNLPQDVTSNFELEGREKIESVAVGVNHSIVLTNKGRLFTFGYSEYGQLGLGYNTDYCVPKDITTNFDIYTLQYKDITNNKFTVTENGVYTVYAKDITGNENIKTVIVDKIDKLLPTITLDGNPTSWVNKDVELTISVDEPYKVLKWSTINKNIGYFENSGTELSNNKFTVSENGEYTIYVMDRAGNETVKTLSVKKIDKELPIIMFETNGSLEGAVIHSTVVDVTENNRIKTIEYLISNDSDNPPKDGWIEINNRDEITIEGEDDQYYIFVKVTDVAGNEVIKVSNSFEVEAPTINPLWLLYLIPFGLGLAYLSRKGIEL